MSRRMMSVFNVENLVIVLKTVIKEKHMNPSRYIGNIMAIL